MFPEAWGKVQATTVIKKLVEQRNDVCLAPMWVSMHCMETWPDSWLLQRHDDDDISTMPPSRGSQAYPLPKFWEFVRRVKSALALILVPKCCRMLCQASIRSRLSKGYLDHDICRWKTGKRFNATGMCTVHSAAYVHIQMLDKSRSSSIKDWLELSQQYPQTFLTVRQPHLSEAQRLATSECRVVPQATGQKRRWSLGNGSCTWTDCL